MKHQKVIIIAVVCFITGFITGVHMEKGIDIPFVQRQDQWSIAIYAGESPLDIASPANVKNPVLTAKDITDVRAVFVADPSIFRFDGKWWMFAQCRKPGFLSLYYAEELTGPWIEHPERPVVFGGPRRDQGIEL